MGDAQGARGQEEMQKGQGKGQGQGQECEPNT